MDDSLGTKTLNHFLFYNASWVRINEHVQNQGCETRNKFRDGFKMQTVGKKTKQKKKNRESVFKICETKEQSKRKIIE